MNTNTMNGKRRVYLCTCRMCGESKTLHLDPKDVEEFQSPNRRHIQDIFPYLSAGDRELLISGTCDDCFTKMFGEDEE